MIYFIQAVDGGPVKIGLAVNMQRRWYELQRTTGKELNVLGVIDGDIKVEKSLHSRFSQERVDKEWFNPSPEILKFIQESARPFDLNRNFKYRPRRKQYLGETKKDSIRVNLFEFWKQQEIAQRRTISITEVSRATGISRDTLTRLKAGRTGHPDLEVISKLCKFFGVDTGPIPFLIYHADD